MQDAHATVDDGESSAKATIRHKFTPGDAKIKAEANLSTTGDHSLNFNANLNKYAKGVRATGETKLNPGGHIFTQTVGLSQKFKHEKLFVKGQFTVAEDFAADFFLTKRIAKRFFTALDFSYNISQNKLLAHNLGFVYKLSKNTETHFLL